MEHLLSLYNRPYDPAEPVVCFDERPCFLIGDTVVPLPMSEGKPKREHYEYEKLGSCVLMVAVDPAAGWRFAKVFQRRRKQEYAQFMKELMDHYQAHRPEVRRVHLVQDNLNTHHAGSFYEQFDAETAHGLEQLCRFHFTPKGASWLNMVEIELSAIVRQCLSRRIASQEVLEREVMALVRERNEKQITIRWQFSVETARQKLNRHYRTAHASNAMYQRT
jgi:hypothetical protein